MKKFTDEQIQEASSKLNDWLDDKIELWYPEILLFLRYLRSADMISKDLSIAICKKINAIEDFTEWANNSIIYNAINMKDVPQEEIDLIRQRVKENWAILDMWSNYRLPVYCRSHIILSYLPPYQD